VKWVVTSGPSESQRASELAEDWGLPFTAQPTEVVPEGWVFVGTDHSLAAFAVTTPGVPVLFAPVGGSDLMRMFSLGGEDIAERTSSGVEYPCDLGIVEHSGGSTPFIGHLVASGTGGLPRWTARRRHLSVTRAGRTTTYRSHGLVIANAQHIGDRTVAPRAALMDGRLDLQILGGHAGQRAQIARSIRRGHHAASRQVVRRSVAEVAFVLPDQWRVTTDGTRLMDRPNRVRIAPAAFGLWV